MAADTFVSAKELAQELSICYLSALELIKTMPHIQVGRIIRVRRSVLDKVLAKMEVKV